MLKFLDIVENPWAGENNPHKVGIFVRYVGKCVELTDGNGDFWSVITDSESNFIVKGNLLDK